MRTRPFGKDIPPKKDRFVLVVDIFEYTGSAEDDQNPDTIDD
jgi:hypothetical protein